MAGTRNLSPRPAPSPCDFAAGHPVAHYRVVDFASASLPRLACWRSEGEETAGFGRFLQR